MAFFGGIHERRLDEKNRVPIPKEWRDAIKDDKNKVVLFARGKKIEVYSTSLWQMLIQRTIEPSLKTSDAKLLAAIGSNSEEKDIDSKGRVQISENMLMRAGIRKDKIYNKDMKKDSIGGQNSVNECNVLIVGSVNHFSIWDPVIFREFEQNTDLEELL